MEDKLDRLQYEFGISVPLYRELRERHAVPAWWFAVSRRVEGEWVRNFHDTMTKFGWEYIVRAAKCGTIDVSLNPFADMKTIDRVIVFPGNVVPLLWELLQAIFGILEAPPSRNPDASMQITPEGFERGVRKTGELIGRLRDTGCPDPTCGDPWKPAVIAASHFIYCHELVHVAIGRLSKEAGWSPIGEELECDRLAFILMALTYRSYPELQSAFALMGPTLAFGLEAVKDEALEHTLRDGVHPPPADRFRTLRNWAEIAERDAMIAAGSTSVGEEFWNLLEKALQRLRVQPALVISPVRDLLSRLSDSTPVSDDVIKEAVDAVLQWCSFGSIVRVKSALKNTLNELLSLGDSRKREAVRRIISGLIKETRHLEKTLGFNDYFGSLCS